MIKVNKPTARKMFRCGVTVHLLPCKVRLDNAWIKPHEISMECCEDPLSMLNLFDRTVRDYEYYNCNAEVGYYCSYYVTEDAYESYEMCKLMC